MKYIWHLWRHTNIQVKGSLLAFVLLFVLLLLFFGRIILVIATPFVAGILLIMALLRLFDV